MEVVLTICRVKGKADPRIFVRSFDWLTPQHAIPNIIYVLDQQQTFHITFLAVASNVSSNNILLWQLHTSHHAKQGGLQLLLRLIGSDQCKLELFVIWS